MDDIKQVPQTLL